MKTPTATLSDPMAASSSELRLPFFPAFTFDDNSPTAAYNAIMEAAVNKETPANVLFNRTFFHPFSVLLKRFHMAATSRNT